MARGARGTRKLRSGFGEAEIGNMAIGWAQP